ncbi:MAG: BatA domain-containing protein [Marinifilaceae bacterium]
MSLQFQHPAFLWALFALIIPILIHLFNFRRYRKVYFSNLQFLKNLQAEHKSKSKLKNLLILLVRLLAMAMLILAFAQPYVPKNKILPQRKDGKELASIYVDNSFSMNAEGEKGKLLEVARNKALQIASSLPGNMRFQVLSNSSSSSYRLLNKEQAIAKLQEIEPASAAKSLSKIVKQSQLIQNPTKYSQTLYILSDFQQSTSDLQRIIPDTSFQIVFLPIQSKAENNLLIDTCWFPSPFHKLDKTEELYVRIRNTSSENYREIPVKLSINDSLRAVASFDIEPHSTQVVVLKYVNKYKGHYKGKIEISDFPITYDNQLYFSYSIANQSKVLVINQETPNKYLEKLFSNSLHFSFKNTTNRTIRNHNILNQNLIILNQLKEMESGLAAQLSSYVRTGGNLLILPSDQAPATLNSFLNEHSCPIFQSQDSNRTRFSKIERNAKLYSDVFKEFREDARLPQLYRFVHLKIPANSLSETLWQGPGKTALLSRTPVGKGNIYLSAIQFDPQWSDVITHPIFVPTLSNMAQNHNGVAPLYYTLGLPSLVHLPNEKLNDRHPLHLQNSKLAIDIIPEQRNNFEKGLEISISDQLTTAGNYSLSSNSKEIDAIAFNYSRQESEQKFYSLHEIEGLIQNLNLFNCSTAEPEPENLILKLEEQRKGKTFWKILILLSIGFLLAEALLQKLKN